MNSIIWDHAIRSIYDRSNKLSHSENFCVFLKHRIRFQLVEWLKSANSMNLTQESGRRSLTWYKGCINKPSTFMFFPMETQNKLFDVSRFPIRKIHLDTSTACFDVADVAGPCRCFWSKATVLFQVVHPSRIRKWIESHPTRIYQGYFLQWKLGLDILFVIYHLTCFFFPNLRSKLKQLVQTIAQPS